MHRIRGPWWRFPIGRVLAGLALMGATVFAAVYAARDIVWLIRKVHRLDVEPWLSGGVLFLAPFLIYGGWQLMVGAYEDRDPISPGALGTLGVGLIGVGVFALVYSAMVSPTIYPRRLAYLFVTWGVGAIVLAWRRYGEAHPRMPPNKRLESTRRMIKE